MLELQAIVKTWQPRTGAARRLLNGVDLVLPPGHTVAILGPSGSGKSTLLKVIAGLEPIDSGVLRFAGQDIGHLPPERRGFALMLQDFALFPHLHVQDNVAFGLIEQGVAKAQARAQAQTLLARLGLGHVGRQKVWTLSGGEQQRVALARAVITQPRVLLLDEPFSALDADLRAQLRDEFAQHTRHSAMATLWVTHDEQEARAVGTQGYRLVQGRLLPLW